MNKILNWTFGACFRTLGRFLAIFIVFALLLFIGSKLDLELPSWLSLKVNASTNSIYVAEYVNSNSSYNEFISYTNGSFSEFTSPMLEDDNKDLRITNTTLTNLTNFKNFDYIYFPIKFDLPNTDIMTQFSTTNDYIIKSNEVTLSVQLNFDNTSSHCFFHETTNNYFIVQCPILQNGNYIKSLDIFYETHFYNPPQLSQVFSITIYRNINYSTSDSVSIQNSINQQTQVIEQQNEKLDDVNQSIQDTNDTLNNEDTQGAQDSASGFFDNFSTETFGLTSIITAPLNAINSIINSSCSNLVLPLPFVEKNLTLPCMTSIYSNYFKGFFDLYQIITTGLISYYIIVRIFNLVKDFKNPEHDEIEVMDL